MTTSELKRVLYVEDEADIREVIQLALEAVGGFSVAPCTSGAEALEQARDFAPQLILLDVMMPVMDGPETLRRLRQIPELSHTPVVFITAKVQAGDLRRYRELGAIDVVVKPFDPMTLSEDLSHIWNRFHERRR